MRESPGDLDRGQCDPSPWSAPWDSYLRAAEQLLMGDSSPRATPSDSWPSARGCPVRIGHRIHSLLRPSGGTTQHVISSRAPRQHTPLFRVFEHSLSRGQSETAAGSEMPGSRTSAKRPGLSEPGRQNLPEEITFGWRDRNLLVEAHIQCIFSTCHSDIGRAGCAWANAIDGEAR